jgi:hypothetical protein
VDAALPRWDASVRGSFRVQMLAENEQAYDVDPYFAILTELHPYWEASASASKAFGALSAVEAGAHVRRLQDEDDEGDYNHDFTRGWLTLSRWSDPCRRFGVSATGEWWSTGDGEDVGAAGFAVDWRPGERWRASAGVDYSLWRSDLYAARERYDSYGVFVRARWRPTARWEGDASVRYDTGDEEDVLTVQLTARWEF